MSCTEKHLSLFTCGKLLSRIGRGLGFGGVIDQAVRLQPEPPEKNVTRFLGFRYVRFFLL